MFNFNKEEIKKEFQGKSNEEMLQLLNTKYNIFWDFHGRNCKFWYANVFTYCSSYQLEQELNFFLWFINFLSSLFGLCFQVEETTYLGRIAPCGHKQTILYYTISFNC